MISQENLGGAEGVRKEGRILTLKRGQEQRASGDKTKPTR